MLVAYDGLLWRDHIDATLLSHSFLSKTFTHNSVFEFSARPSTHVPQVLILPPTTWAFSINFPRTIPRFGRHLATMPPPPCTPPITPRRCTAHLSLHLHHLLSHFSSIFSVRVFSTKHPSSSGLQASDLPPNKIIIIAIIIIIVIIIMFNT